MDSLPVNAREPHIETLFAAFDVCVIVAFTALVAYQLYRGVTVHGFRGSGKTWHTYPQKVYRSEDPWIYWFCVAPQIPFLAWLIFTK
ncbi:MAG: hypothetical protein R3C49_23815 [Planctomycetaceae bacterium]